MFRKLLLLMALFGLAPVCRGADEIALRIVHVGLGGKVSADGQRTWIQAAVRNTTRQSLAFDLLTAELALNQDARPVTGTLRLPVTLRPGESRTVDLALNISLTPNAVLLLTAVDADGKRLGAAARKAPTEKSEEKRIAALCASPEICNGIRRTLLFSGSEEEQSRKSGSLRLIQVQDAPPVWWGWDGVAAVIVALPAAHLSAAQREALEVYLLNGGTVVLLEDQLKDGVPLEISPEHGRTGFLEAYRRSLPPGRPRDVSSGQLVRFASASGKDFADYLRTYGLNDYTPPDLSEVVRRFRKDDCDCGNADRTGWMIKRLGTSFRFPSFREVLSWMAGYLFLAGILNFLVLRKLGRPEWGWVTIPVLAVVFSCALYLAGARNRPRNFALDEMTVYRMDARSPLAVTDLKIRVSAPFRSTVFPNVPGQFLFDSGLPNGLADDSVDFASPSPPGEYLIGDRWESPLALRKWSFQDLDFSASRRFPGTVYRDPQGQLHNDTGVNFEQAMVVTQESVFQLGIFPSGAVVDLARVPRKPYSQEAGRQIGGYPVHNYPGIGFPAGKDHGESASTVEDQARFTAEWVALPSQPFSVLEFIRGWPANGKRVFSHTRAVFFGYSKEATSGASLRGLHPNYKARSLTVVTFGEWP